VLLALKEYPLTVAPTKPVTLDCAVGTGLEFRKENTIS